MGAKVMSDILLIILPLVVVGIAMIVFINTIKKRNEKRKYLKDNPSNNKEEDYMALGTALGICFGGFIGTIFMKCLGVWSISYGACFGMLGGMLIGMTIKKK